MPKSFMQHQREIDRASDIELDMECIEQDMREMQPFLPKLRVLRHELEQIRDAEFAQKAAEVSAWSLQTT